MVLQGEWDIRVPKDQAMQLVDILQKAGKTVEVKYYPDEGHGFMKRERTSSMVYPASVAWFDKYSPKAPQRETPAEK